MRHPISSSTPIVQILLSTYNGERFLDPLVESVLSQEGVDSRVLVRDDGSRDRTPEMLMRHEGPRFARSDPGFGENLGVFRSYFELLTRADPAAGYYAFCDQDDVWLPDKLARAVATLEKENRNDGKPLLYCGRQTLVDEELQAVGLSRIPPRGPGFGNALVENIATGCTVVLNGAARDALILHRPETVVMHDWWGYIVVSALGRVVFDPEPQVLYRQHAGNVIGVAGSRLAGWRRRVERFRRHKDHGESPLLWTQAREFRELFGDRLNTEQRRTLDRFIDRRRSILAGLGYALRPDVFRQTRIDDWVLRTLMATRRI